MGAEDYGMRVWDANGNLKLDVTDRVTRLRYENSVDEESNGNSGALADIDGYDSIQFSISQAKSGFGDHEHLVTRSGTTITWVHRSIYSLENMTIMCFLY